MPRTLVTSFILLTAAFVLTGCIATELRVTNRTGGSIRLYTDHTKKTYEIAPGATFTVPHTAGTVVITASKGVEWKYEELSVPDPSFSQELKRSYKRLTLPFSIDANGTLTLPSGRQIHPVAEKKEDSA